MEQSNFSLGFWGNFISPFKNKSTLDVSTDKRTLISTKEIGPHGKRFIPGGNHHYFISSGLVHQGLCIARSSNQKLESRTLTCTKHERGPVISFHKRH